MLVNSHVYNEYSSDGNEMTHILPGWRNYFSLAIYFTKRLILLKPNKQTQYVTS